MKNKIKLSEVGIIILISIIWGLFHVIYYPKITFYDYFLMCFEFCVFSFLILIINKLNVFNNSEN
jgi:hypothetical protein